jgi:glutathione S-transferase
MSELILHHYPQSHFAEKIKRLLAYKGMPWRAVEQPLMMPKPDLVPLTGGVRRRPVDRITRQGARGKGDRACALQAREQHPRRVLVSANLAVTQKGDQ